MKVQTFKVINYRDCPVYFRALGRHFEYLTIINNELYTAHISITPTIFNRLLYWFKIEKMSYSAQQQVAIVKQLNRIAETTIDFILDKKENSNENK